MGTGTALTGKAVTVTGILAYRIADGELAEIWVQSDTLGLLQQIGAVPALGQAAG
jgi:predicted ester cyclase